MSSKTGLLQLAPEILIEILLYLDVRDAYAIQSTNRFFNDIYKGSLELQYALECRVAHVRSNPNCHLPIGDRLQMLRDREAAWRSMEPTSTRMISPAPYCKLRSILPAIERDHLLLYDDPTIHSLSMRKSENAFRSLLEITNLKYICCCIEEHDLIACLSRIHLPNGGEGVKVTLIQHSTGAAHPLAANSTIILEVPSKFKARCSMEVFGENLVVAIHSGGKDWLYVYDWMMGMTKCEPCLLSTATDVVVLDKDLILITDLTTWSFHIYYIPPSSTGGTVKLICRLCLPLFADPNECNAISGFECHSAPNPTGNGEFPKHVPSSVPFIDDPKTALILVMFLLWETLFTLDDHFISLVVHRNSIIDVLPPPKNWSTAATPVVVDWKTWGPSVTHWSDTSIDGFSAFRNIVHGQRLVLPVSSHQTDYEGSAALVKDLNKYHVRSCDMGKERDNFEGAIFASHSIKNTLPFRMNYLPIQSKCDHYSITDNLILGLTKAKDNRSGGYSVQVMHFGD